MIAMLSGKINRRSVIVSRNRFKGNRKMKYEKPLLFYINVGSYGFTKGDCNVGSGADGDCHPGASPGTAGTAGSCWTGSIALKTCTTGYSADITCSGGNNGANGPIKCLSGGIL